jgi:hypothetical protein
MSRRRETARTGAFPVNCATCPGRLSRSRTAKSPAPHATTEYRCATDIAARRIGGRTGGDRSRSGPAWPPDHPSNKVNCRRMRLLEPTHCPEQVWSAAGGRRHFVATCAGTAIP